MAVELVIVAVFWICLPFSVPEEGIKLSDLNFFLNALCFGLNAVMDKTGTVTHKAFQGKTGLASWDNRFVTVITNYFSKKEAETVCIVISLTAQGAFLTRSDFKRAHKVLFIKLADDMILRKIEYVG